MTPDASAKRPLRKEARQVATRKRDADSSQEAPPRRSIYRRIVTVVVASLIAYLIGVACVSVIPQIFWPQTGEIADDLTCREGLQDLRTELLDYSGDRVRNPGSETALASFFTSWDLRHFALESRCEAGSEQEAWDLLGQLRQRVQGTLERYDREEAELARAMQSTLAAPAR